MPIRTTVVGSWPIPFGQRLELKRYYAGELSDEEANGLLQTAARIAMDEQVACGLDQIMGGEVFAPDFLHHIPPRLDGLETLAPRITSRGQQGVGRYQVVGKVTAPRGTGHAKAWRREREIEPRLDKASVPSPLTIGGGFVTDQDASESGHMNDLIEVVQDEIADMVQNGLEEIQLDAPGEAINLVSERETADALLPLVKEPLEPASAITRERSTSASATSPANPRSRCKTCARLIPFIQQLEGIVDRVHVECSYSGQWQEHGLLAELPESMQIIAGIADVKSTARARDRTAREDRATRRGDSARAPARLDQLRRRPRASRRSDPADAQPRQSRRARRLSLRSNTMEIRALGRTGVQVSSLCLGCMMFGRRTEPEESYAIIDRALDAGINFLDTANVYALGRSEEIAGEALKRNGRRHNVVLATKVHGQMDAEDPNARGNSRRHIIEQCEASLRRLQTDYIDLYQLHRPQADIPIDETLRALDDLIRDGKVRYIGTSNFAGWELVESLWVAKELGLNRVVCEQPAYNLLDRRVESELLPAARTFGIAVIPWGPLGGGLLSGRYQRGEPLPADGRYALNQRQQERVTDGVFDIIEGLSPIAQEKGCTLSQLSLAWCEQQPGVTSPIIGPRTMEQLEDNLGSADVTITEEDRERIDAINPPGWTVTPYYELLRRPHEYRIL